MSNAAAAAAAAGAAGGGPALEAGALALAPLGGVAVGRSLACLKRMDPMSASVPCMESWSDVRGSMWCDEYERAAAAAAAAPRSTVPSLLAAETGPEGVVRCTAGPAKHSECCVKSRNMAMNTGFVCNYYNMTG